MTLPAVQALASLTGARHGTEVGFDVVADHDGITHAVTAASTHVDSVAAQLRAALPGLRLTPDDRLVRGSARLTVRLFVGRHTVLQTSEIAAASRSLLSGLSRLADDEMVILRWRLGATHNPPEIPEEHADKQLVRALRRRHGQPGFRVAGTIQVQATSMARARALADHVVACVRSRKAAGAGLQPSFDRSVRPLTAQPKITRSSGWLSAAEIVSLLGWPLGDSWIEGIQVGASREVPATRDIGRGGRFLFTASDGRGDRPVALDAAAARLHQLVIGPTGSGKSTVLARGVLDDLAASHAGVLLDPKSDLIQTVIDRVPAEHADRVVTLDPASSGPVPGLQVFGHGDPDLRADVLVGALRSIFGADWGVRSDLYGRLALRSLAEVPGASLLDFGRLFSDAAFRRRAMAHQSDPLTVAAWQTYEQMSSAEQLNHVQAPMARVMALLSRPALRMVLAQPAPKLDLIDLMNRRMWLLIDLSPGVLGEPAARLLGAIVSFLVWTALEARVTTPAAERTPVFLVFDEFQALSELPMSIERIAERARGLGGGLVVGTQTIGRMPESTRHAILGNFSSVVSFRTGADEATKLAREFSGLTAQDLQGLGSYEVVARVATGQGSQVRTVTGRTEPLPPMTGQGDRIRAASAERYGARREDVDAHLRDELPSESSSAVGRMRRST